MRQGSNIGAVAIGRNEGDRLKRCLESLSRDVSWIVYVDSGSTDGSVELAQQVGAEVVALDLARPFTAARARNEGYARLRKIAPKLDYVQFIDGDCELRAGWIEAAGAALDADLDLAVVCGRRRERFPEASLWNRLIDAEWDTPVGPAQSCGGDALIRTTALEDINGYRENLIAGEEPEMCLRLRAAGWRIARIDAEMTWHDAALKTVSQWWTRNRRAGHAFAEVSNLHRASPDGFWVRETRRALFWGAIVPGISVLGAIFTPWALAILLAIPTQIMRLALKGWGWPEAVFATLGKMPEAAGVLSFWIGRMLCRQRRLIEYK